LPRLARHQPTFEVPAKSDLDRWSTRQLVETCYDPDAQEYVATVIDPTGLAEETRVKSAAAFSAWLLLLERTFMADGWHPEGLSARHVRRPLDRV
jgi:hypothetical protein